MDLESLTLLFLSPLALLLVLGLMILGIGHHVFNLEMAFRRIFKLTNGQISRRGLYEKMSQSQGSNFNTFAISAWSLLFVTITYFYFLTPIGFRLNYFSVPDMASSSLGFFALGAITILVTGLIAASFPWFYSFYEIPWITKKFIMVCIPLLGISLFCSAYAGTLYPQNAPALTEIAAFLGILVSEVILLSPFFTNIGEVAR